MKTGQDQPTTLCGGSGGFWGPKGIEYVLDVGIFRVFYRFSLVYLFVNPDFFTFTLYILT